MKSQPKYKSALKRDKIYILSPIDIYLKVNIFNQSLELALSKKGYKKYKCLTLFAFGDGSDGLDGLEVKEMDIIEKDKEKDLEIDANIKDIHFVKESITFNENSEIN